MSNFYFHKSFSLDCTNLAKVLALVSDNPSVSLREIAAETGIGVGKSISDGKVRTTLQYAAYCGLLEPASLSKKRQDLLLTTVGQIVSDYDKRLSTLTSQWVLHYFLSRLDGTALAWQFFVHEFLPTYTQFNGDLLKEKFGSKFTHSTERNNKEYKRILTNCYLENNALAKIRLLRSEAKNEYARDTPNYPNAYLLAYILAEIWEARHPDKMMVEPAVLLEKGHLATTIGLPAEDLPGLLQDLNAVGAIEQMREAPPFQVVRRWEDKHELLRRAYQEG